MRRSALCLAALALCLFALQRPLAQSRQAAAATIVGSVVDGRMQPLAGVRVTLLRQGAANISRTTDSNGRFQFDGVLLGSYTVRAELKGFTTLSRELVVTASFTLPLVLRSVDPASETSRVTPETGTAARALPPAAPPPPASSAGSAGGTGIGAGTGTGVNRGVVGGVEGGVPGGVVGGLVAPLPARGSGGGTGGGVFRPVEAPTTASYAHVDANRFKLTADDPLSTFAADVDTASFTNVRRFLTKGQLPPVDAVRVEELLNYFRFDYPEPAASRPVSITTEVGDCPWEPSHKLVLIGARAKAIDQREVTGRNIVLLIDVSGSMAPPERLPLIKTGLRMFVDTLRDQDRIAMVVYAGASGLALPSTPGRQRQKIHDAIESLNAGGSTNGAEGMLLAYRVAREEFIPGGVNRVILATDGDFNVGVTSQGDLLKLIERERESGVFLSVLGVGDHNLKDSTMEMLADKGNGHYSYLDSLPEARRVLVREGGATLETVAKDVKFQVEFNPSAVSAWKLIGYENRLLQHQEFNDDTRDGGELGAGHTVTVLYEVVPSGAALPSDARSPSGRPAVDPLVYQTARRPTESSELMTVKVRYKLPSASESQLMTQAVRSGGRATNLPFAAAVAEFGLLLRDAKAADERWTALVRRTESMTSPLKRTSDSESFSELVATAAGLKKLR